MSDPIFHRGSSDAGAPIPAWVLESARCVADCTIFQLEERQMSRAATAGAPTTAAPTTAAPTTAAPTTAAPTTAAATAGAATAGAAAERIAGPRHCFYVIRAPDWVNVIALTPDDVLVMIRQWRIGVQRTTLEIPGGMIDPGETPFDAAVRELREESGFEARRWVSLGHVEPNPAIQTNRCYTFLALDAVCAGPPSFDETEHCVTVLEPFERTAHLIAAGDITHSLVVAALQLEQLRRRGLLVGLEMSVEKVP